MLSWENLMERFPKQAYDELIEYASDLGMENGFVQEEGTAEESFIPAFDLEGVFAEKEPKGKK